MGTILSRKRKDGTMGHTAVIRIKRDGKLVHSETETFERKQAAEAWMKKRETELAQPGALSKPKDPALKDVIDEYLRDNTREYGKTKDQVLATIKKSEFGGLRCSEVTSQEVVSYIKSIDAQPSTRGNYLSHLSAVVAIAKPAYGYPLEKQALEDARAVLSNLGIIGKSKQRTRRPTLAELDTLLTYFADVKRRRPKSIPMVKMILFAIFSTRRQEEITRITLQDLHREDLEIWVRDMKHPGEKIGNDVRTTLTPEALRLIDAQCKDIGLKEAGTIFPYSAESTSTAFTNACKFLGIVDLHFHDLRHEGISRLFEMDWTIPRVATVSAHRNWQSLQRYTQYKKAGDKYKDWKWLELATLASQ